MGGGIARGAAQQHEVLADWRMERRGNLPAAAGNGVVDLGEGHEAEFRVAGGDQGVRLADVLAHDDAALESFVHAQRAHGVPRRGAVGREFGVRDGELAEVAAA